MLFSATVAGNFGQIVFLSQKQTKNFHVWAWISAIYDQKIPAIQWMAENGKFSGKFKIFLPKCGLKFFSKIWKFFLSQKIYQR